MILDQAPSPAVVDLGAILGLLSLAGLQQRGAITGGDDHDYQDHWHGK